jgi:hypothetical protein
VEWNWQGKTCPSATLSTTNPTWTDPGSNPGLRGGRSVANRLIHGTALLWTLQSEPSDHTTIWSIMWSALFDIWQVCPPSLPGSWWCQLNLLCFHAVICSQKRKIPLSREGVE